MRWKANVLQLPIPLRKITNVKSQSRFIALVALKDAHPF